MRADKANPVKRLVLFIGEIAGAGGAERLLLEEERYFRERGLVTTLLAFRVNPEALFDYQPKQIRNVDAGSKLGSLLALRRSLQELRPDLIIANSNSEAVMLYLAGFGLRLRYAVHIHGSYFWFPEDNLKYAWRHRRILAPVRASVAGHTEFIPARRAFNPVQRLKLEFLARLDYVAVRRACEIITLTEQLQWEIKLIYQRRAVVARGCLPERLTEVLPAAVIRERYGITDQRIIFSVGRLEYRKRIDLLIQSFAQISGDVPDVVLLIGGTGEARQELEKLARELGVSDRVIFAGFIPDSELYDHYAACDVFAFPSWTSSGITPYEALLAGAKVIWTSEADEPERILTSDHVFLADPDVASFAEKLRQALDSQPAGKVDLSGLGWRDYCDTVAAAVLPE